MQFPGVPDNEAARLASLRELELLDGEHQQTFQNAAQLAARIFGSKSALVSLVDNDRQWFAAKFNFELSGGDRNTSFCGHVVASGKTMVVPDARLDPRFHDNPLVLGAANIVFYAGAPLSTPDNLTLGTLCVLDDKPGTASDEQIEALESLAQLVVQQMETRRALLRERAKALAAELESRTAHRTLRDYWRTAQTGFSRLLAPLTSTNSPSIESTKSSTTNTVKVSSAQPSESIQAIDPDALLATPPHVSAIAPYTIALNALSALGALASTRGVELTITASPEDEALVVETDGDRLRAILHSSLTGTLQQVSDGSLSIRFESSPENATIDFKIDARGNIDSLSSLASLLDVSGNSNGDANLKLLESIAGQLQGRDITGQTTESLSYRITLPMAISASSSP